MSKSLGEDQPLWECVVAFFDLLDPTSNFMVYALLEYRCSEYSRHSSEGEGLFHSIWHMMTSFKEDIFC